jgi:hypothetical protein
MSASPAHQSAPEPRDPGDEVQGIAQRVVEIVRARPRHHDKTAFVEEELRDFADQQQALGRDRALREIDIWLGPVLSELDKETADGADA